MWAGGWHVKYSWHHQHTAGHTKHIVWSCETIVGVMSLFPGCADNDGGAWCGHSVGPDTFRVPRCSIYRLLLYILCTAYRTKISLHLEIGFMLIVSDILDMLPTWHTGLSIQPCKPSWPLGCLQISWCWIQKRLNIYNGLAQDGYMYIRIDREVIMATVPAIYCLRMSVSRWRPSLGGIYQFLLQILHLPTLTI